MLDRELLDRVVEVHRQPRNGRYADIRRLGQACQAAVVGDLLPGRPRGSAPWIPAKGEPLEPARWLRCGRGIAGLALAARNKPAVAG